MPQNTTQIYENVDLKAYPKIDAADPSSQLTIGDLHGNALKFIYFLVKHKVLALQNGEADYEKLVGIYDRNCVKFEDVSEFGTKPLTLSLKDFKDFNEILKNANINPKITTTPDFIVRLIGDELADRGANDYFTLKVFQKLNGGEDKKGIKIPVETLLSNHGAEFIEATETRPTLDFIPTTAKFTAYPNKLYIKIEINPNDGKEALLAVDVKGTHIITKERFIQILGNEETDKIFNALRTNSDQAALQSYQDKIFKAFPPLTTFKSVIDKKGQVNSLLALQKLVNDGHCSEAEVLELSRANYKQTLKALSYTLSADKSEITLYSHAPVGLEVIKAVAKKLGVTYKDASAKALAQTIDLINDIFQKEYVQTNKIKSLYDAAFKDNDTAMPETHPFELLIWHREKNTQFAVERPLEHNHYKINYVHGHDGSGIVNAKDIYNLNNGLGQFDNYEAYYTVVQAQGSSRSSPTIVDLYLTYLKEKFKDRYTPELLASIDKDVSALLQALNFYQQKCGDNLNFQSIASKNEDTRNLFENEKNTLFTLLDNTLNLTVENGQLKYSPFDENRASTVLLENSGKFNFSSPRDVHAQPQNLGIPDKFLNGSLQGQEWLTEADLNRLTEACGIKNQVHITRLDPKDLGTILSFHRENQEKKVGNKDEYRIPLLLNKGSAGTDSNQGTHWTQATIVVNPGTKTVKVLFKDSFSMSDLEKEAIKQQLEAAVKYTEESQVAGVTKKFQAFPDYAIEVIAEGQKTQKDMWSCGYRALKNMIDDPLFNGLNNPSFNKLKGLREEDHSLTSTNLRNACYEALLGSMQVSEAAMTSSTQDKTFFDATNKAAIKIKPERLSVYLETHFGAPKSTTSSPLAPAPIKTPDNPFSSVNISLCEDPDEEDETVTPTLVALPQSISIRPSKISSKPSQSGSLSDDDSISIDIQLRLYAALSEHYAHWSHLAKGSWGELEKLGQIKINCESMIKELANPQFTNLAGLQTILQTLHSTHKVLEQIQSSGPLSTYFFCDRQLNPSSSSFLTDIATELKTITGSNVNLDHLRDFTLGSVSTGTAQSAFVQGVRKNDGVFVSEAYISPSLNSDKDKLREFVFDQIESFHADPRNVGKKISFQGNFTQEYLILAANYCNLRGYAWQITDTLKNNILSKLSGQEKAEVINLFNHQPNKPGEQDWKSWLEANNKYPFSKLLDKETQNDYEGQLRLTPLTAKEKTVAEAAVSNLVTNAASAVQNWQPINNSTPITDTQPTRTMPISKNPQAAAFSLSLTNSKEGKEVLARLGRKKKNEPTEVHASLSKRSTS